MHLDHLSVEERLARLEKRTMLDKSLSLKENIDRWFTAHVYLQTQQFELELQAIGLVYSSSTVVTSLHRLWKAGKVVRVSNGVYKLP